MNGKEAVISKNYGTTFRKKVQPFAARISGVFPDVVEPGGESGNH